MGATPKIWQYTVAAVALWAAFVGLSLFWNIQAINSEIVLQTDTQAQENLKQDLAILLWSNEHGGIYLHVDERTKPSPFLEKIPHRDVPAPDGGMLTLQNPVASLREIKEKQGRAFRREVAYYESDIHQPKQRTR